MPILEEIAGAGVGTGLGLITGAINQNQNRKAQERQFGMQKELNQQAKDLALQQWKDTNYNAQRKELEKAGLNVGLLYGGSGGGGVTANTGSGGSAPSQAPTNYEIGGMAIQGAQAAANLKLTEAQTENVNADTENKTGVERENKTADTGVKTTQKEAGEIANRIAGKTIEEVISGIKANADKAQSEARSSLIEANVDETTRKEREDKIRSEAINEAFKLTLMKSNVNLNNEKARAVTQELAQEWERLSIELDKVGIGKMQNAINEFTAKVNARLGQGNLNMRGIEAGLNATGKIFGKGGGITNTGERKTTINNY